MRRSSRCPQGQLRSACCPVPESCGVPIATTMAGRPRRHEGKLGPGARPACEGGPSARTVRAPAGTAGADPSRAAGDDGQHEAVVPLAAHGLDHGRAHARLPGPPARSSGARRHARVGAGPVDDRTVPDDVVGDDEASPPGKLERPGEVVRIAGLVGVDEDEVKGAAHPDASCGRRSSARPTRTSTAASGRRARGSSGRWRRASGPPPG